MKVNGNMISLTDKGLIIGSSPDLNLRSSRLSLRETGKEGRGRDLEYFITVEDVSFKDNSTIMLKKAFFMSKTNTAKGACNCSAMTSRCSNKSSYFKNLLTRPLRLKT